MVKSHNPESNPESAKNPISVSQQISKLKVFLLKKYSKPSSFQALLLLSVLGLIIFIIFLKTANFDKLRSQVLFGQNPPPPPPPEVLNEGTVQGNQIVLGDVLSSSGSINLDGNSDCPDGQNAVVHLWWSADTGDSQFYVFKITTQQMFGPVSGSSYDSGPQPLGQRQSWGVKGASSNVNSASKLITTDTCGGEPNPSPLPSTRPLPSPWRPASPSPRPSSLPTLSPRPSSLPGSRLPPCYFGERGYGDANGDGVINESDQELAAKIAFKQIIPSADQRKAVDVDGNGIIDFGGDAILIAKYASGVISTFPICSSVQPSALPTLSPPIRPSGILKASPYPNCTGPLKITSVNLMIAGSKQVATQVDNLTNCNGTIVWVGIYEGGIDVGSTNLGNLIRGGWVWSACRVSGIGCSTFHSIPKLGTYPIVAVADLNRNGKWYEPGEYDKRTLNVQANSVTP